MNRIQLALNVDDVDAAVAFYSKLFDTEPAKRRPGYANFAISQPPLKLVLLENPGQGGTLNHLGVEVATAFYATLFGVEPAKVRPGYANFAIADPPLKLVLLERPGQGGTLNHLGVEVESTEAVDATQARLAERGLTSMDERDERGTTCCYAKQDKFWVADTPDGEQWEIYAVLADSETFFDSAEEGPACCATGEQASDRAPAAAACC